MLSRGNLRNHGYLLKNGKHERKIGEEKLIHKNGLLEEGKVQIIEEGKKNTE